MMQFYVIKRNCTNFQNSKIVKKTSLLSIGYFFTIVMHAYDQNIYLCLFLGGWTPDKNGWVVGAGGDPVGTGGGGKDWLESSSGI